MSSIDTTGSLKTFWRSIETCAETSSESVSSSFSSSAEAVNWMIANRGGMAQITGLVMVPSQFLGPDAAECRRIVDAVCDGGRAERISIPLPGEHPIEGMIYYPEGYNRDDGNRVILYHNPNGITLAQYFEDGELSWTPGEILNRYQCPIILYDYRGTGMNQEKTSLSSMQFHPTYLTIQEDGLASLKYAATNYYKIDVWGSSLGGGVATASLETYLESFVPGDSHRITLTNHDSFTTTPRVVYPTGGKAMDFVGSVLGANLNAQQPMAKLIDRGVKITILCHLRDPVIPEGARMSEMVESLGVRENVQIITSEQYGHANLSHDMLRLLRD